MATHSSILVWEIPWTEEPGGLQSMASQSRTRLSAHPHAAYWEGPGGLRDRAEQGSRGVGGEPQGVGKGSSRTGPRLTGTANTPKSGSSKELVSLTPSAP